MRFAWRVRLFKWNARSFFSNSDPVFGSLMSIQLSTPHSVLGVFNIIFTFKRKCNNWFFPRENEANWEPIWRLDFACTSLEQACELVFLRFKTLFESKGLTRDQQTLLSKLCCVSEAGVLTSEFALSPCHGLLNNVLLGKYILMVLIT